MIGLPFLIGVVAAQATGAPHPSHARCRAPDGRYIMKCYPRGTVVKMAPPGRAQISVSEVPAAKPTPTAR